ncbi:MAG: RluA family pseudouridine synthase [Chloracidobacterium sp.]|nr:RluA family pseudouridine synthase [Chloracidobacterium sp.]
MVNSEPQSIILTSTAADAGKRLDAFLAEHIEGWSRSQLQKLIENGDVLVNERPAKASYKLRPGDELDIDLIEEPAARFEPENIPLDIVFEDEYLAVINKPAGMVVHPGAGIASGTLANAIAWHFGIKGSPLYEAGVDAPAFQGADGVVLGGEQNLNAPVQPPATAGGTDSRGPAAGHRVGIVHRLDKDTSGLIVVAKDEQTQEKLAEQFRNRTVEKTYVALVHGSPRDNSGTIDRPITRDRWHRTKMTVAANGRQAISHWRVRQRFEKFTLLEVEIKTGRTHQIRVHLASVNHPVVGDTTYNEGRDNTIANIEVKKAVEKLGRFFLHAERLAFTHPNTSERLSFTSELPAELAQLLTIL